MNTHHVLLQVALQLGNVRAELARKCSDVTKTVNKRQMCFQITLVCKYSAADVTSERLDVTNTVHCSHVLVKVAYSCELPAANVTRVLGVRMLWFFCVALSMRSVVVSADC